MRIILLLLSIVLCFGMVSCGGKSEKDKMMEKEMKSKSEVRIKLLDEYKSCVSKAQGNETKIRECESLLKAADKVK